MSETESSNDCEMAGQEEETISAREKEIASTGRDFSSYTKDANFCIYFKIVHNRAEAEEDIKGGAFYPDFVHQFFTESERIFGYKNPIIRIFYTPSRLKRFFKFEFEDELVMSRDRINPDNVLKALSPVLEDIEYTNDINQFIKQVESEEEKTFKPCGELIGEYTNKYRTPKLLSRAQLEQLESAGENMLQHNGKSEDFLNKKTNGETKTTIDEGSKTKNLASASSSKSNNELDDPNMPTKSYQFYHANHETKGFDKIQANMQSLIMWFIESATMIDYTDPLWDFFLVYEKFNATDNNDVQVSTEDRYYFCGYATVYRYYAYPDKIRPRISQVLILPPYRRNGIGTALLDSIYNFYRKNKSTLDITVEDPDEEFIVMRDFLDCRNCIKLDSFQPEKLKQGWNKSMAKECQDKLKLCQRQARKVYEILKLRSIDSSDEDEFRAYRLEIKNRLNIPNQRLKLDCDKAAAKGCEVPEDVKKLMENPKLSIAQLDDNFQELFKQYQHTINKLNKIKSI